MTKLKLSEKDFSQQVVDLARTLGWRVYRTWSSIHSPRGFPDLTLCKPPHLIYAELKVGKGTLTEAQGEWLTVLRACPGVQTFVWFPEDLERIVEILGGKLACFWDLRLGSY